MPGSSAADIQRVWAGFDSFPMETLTKAWHLKNAPDTRQRRIWQMADHRRRTGASGNCFDLSLWLMDEYRKAGIFSYGVGHDLGTEQAHVAVVALDGEGRRYFCDMGDLWILPMPLDGDEGLPSKQAGLFTGCWITAEIRGNVLDITYDRPGGKQSHQSCGLDRISNPDFFELGNASQGSFSAPLVEMRILREQETVHWEFEGERSFVSSMHGLEEEAPLGTFEHWSERISQRTGMNAAYVLECLRAYAELSKELS